MSDELLDIYDANLTYIGVKPRAAVHRDGDWHRTFHCFVIYRDADGQDHLIVQKRGPDKDTCPNMLDVSAAGHYSAGETMQDGVREVQEELGLTVRFDELIPLGKRVSAAKYDGVLDYQVSDVFFYICNQPLADYTIEAGDIAGLVDMQISETMQLLTGAITSIECDAAGFATPTIEIRAADFIQTVDEYFMKILLLAKRCLDGERPLLI